MSSLSFERRKRRILEYLNREGKVEVPVLADEFQVSTETIRRDLERLDQIGKLKKVYGGAVKVHSGSSELPFDEKTRLHAREKAAIGRYAASMVKDGDSIMLANGTTTMEIIPHLADKPNVTIITHSTPAMLLAMDRFPGRILFVGGEINVRQKSTSGPLAELILNQLRVNKAFISTGGISLIDGITDYELEEASISKKMIERADESIFLADHSKFGKSTFANVCPLEDAYTIVTDRACPVEWRNYLAERDITLHIADEGEDPA